MSYLPANLRLMAEALDGASKWFLYRSADPLGTVTGPGYITDADDHEMSVGDLVLVQEAASPVYQWLEVARLVAGAADLVDGLKPPDGLAPITSPRLNGTPLSPTPGMADATTRIATTEWVQAQAYLRGNQKITLSGDVTGTGTTHIKTVAVGLHGQPISSAAPQDGQILVWTETGDGPNGGAWTPAPPVGATGEKGDKGDKGDTGDTGPQGEAGTATAGGTVGQVQFHNASHQLAGVTMSGDATWDTASGILHLTGTGPFLPIAGGTVTGPLIVDVGTRTTTTAGPGVWAMWVNADYQNYAGGSNSFMDGLAIRTSAGGATTTGNICGLDVHATLTSPTSPANAGRNYQGIFSWGEALSGDGGTGLTLATAKGGIFGGGSIGYLHAGATNLLNVTSWEFDVCAAAGSSVWLKTGIQIGGVPVGGVADTVHGTWEALIDLFGTGSGSVGFNHGILLNDLHGGPPLTTTGKFVGTDGAAHTIGAGIDFGNYTITGNVLSWLGGAITGSGYLTLTGGVQALGYQARSGTAGALQVNFFNIDWVGGAAHLWIDNVNQGAIAVGGPYAPLNAPVFTGDARAVTASPGDADTSIATTAFVAAAITAAPNKTITLSGDIAGTGTAAITTTLPNVNANVGTFNNVTINAKGQATAGSNTAYLTASGVSGMTAGQIPIAATATTITSSGNLSGAVTTSGSLATTLANNAVATANITNANVTYAKIQNVAANQLLGNITGSAAAPAEIALPLAVALGGTNATSAAAALTSLGAAPLASPSFTGNVGIAGTLTTGSAVGTGDASIELGGGRSGSGTAYIDFHAVTGTDYETRLIRNAGANGTVVLANTGTGSILLQIAAVTAATLANGGALTLAAGLSVGNNANPSVALFSGTFTQIASPDTVSGAATGTILVGAAANPDNHYRNDTHNFHNRAASVAYAAMTATGTTIGNPTGGAKGAGTINAVQVYGAGTLLTSDARLKRDIEPLPRDCLRLVRAVEPKTFRFVPGEGGSPGFWERRHWGFVAQEMREAIPDAVEEDEAGNLSISQGDLIACLWKSVRELSAHVARLEGGHTHGP